MNNDNQYYTPALEEFCDGFEYEEAVANRKMVRDVHPEWIKKTYRIGTPLIKQGRMSDHYRVKYLDREDIESIGIELREPKMKMIGDDDLEMWDDGMRIGFFDTEYEPGEANVQISPSKGRWVIRNKSELRQLLRFAGYEIKMGTK